jgi:hypothetical protein
MTHGTKGHQPGSKSHTARVKAARKTAKGKKVEAKGQKVTEDFLVGDPEDLNLELAQVTQVSGGGRFKVKFSEDGPDVTATMLAGTRLKGSKILNSNAATKLGDFVIALWSKEAENAHQKQGTIIQGKVPANLIGDAKKVARKNGYSWPKRQSDELFEKANNSNNSVSTRSASTRKKSRSQSRNNATE